MNRVKVGVLGCGYIADVYLKNLTEVFDIIEVKGVTDLVKERRKVLGEKYDIPVIYDDLEQMLADAEIEIILNLTTPPNHFKLSKICLEAGKHVYVEKPLSVTRMEGNRLKEMAKKRGLLLCGAPDTFLGGGIQTCRKLIDDGWIGRPVAATSFLTNHGHENWHPDPEFYYQIGGGPMLDMGPYYLTALINLMGPVKSVAGSTAITFNERTITSEKKYGKIIDVEIPTHLTALLNFECGAVCNMITSFDIWGTHLPHIEIYGTLGSLSIPDPNYFKGPILYKKGDSEWCQIPVIHEYTLNSRGLGLADMAMALRKGRSPRTSSDLTYHVLDIMQAIHESSDKKAFIELDSSCEKPAPMPINLLHGMVN